MRDHFFADGLIKVFGIFAISAFLQVSHGQAERPAAAGTVPAIDEQSAPTQARVLVQGGRELLRQGKKDEAEVRFKQALKIDPQNKEAFDELKPLKEEKFREELRRRRALEDRIILGEGDPWRSYSFSNGVPRLRTNHLAGSAPSERLQRKP